MEKQRYTEAQMEVICWEQRDIITTSGVDTDATVTAPTGGGGGVVLPDDEW